MDLPDDFDKLEAQLDPTARYVVKVLRQTNDELRSQIAVLNEQLSEFKRLLFGKRCEKLPSIQSEIRRVVSANELTVEGKPMPQEPEQRAHQRRRKARAASEPARKSKRGLRKSLPVITETVHVNHDDLPDGMTPDDFRQVSTAETVRRIEHVREHLVVVEYQLQTIAAKQGDTIIKARVPDGVIEGGQYGAGVYAHVITNKWANMLPLYRIEKMLERAGCPIARSTLCEFFHRGAQLLTPIYKRLMDIAKHDAYLHADETTLKVQNEHVCLTGWIWALLSRQAIVYVFNESRSGAVAKDLLGNTNGFLVIDGYAAYNGVTSETCKNARRMLGSLPPQILRGNAGSATGQRNARYDRRAVSH